MPRVLVVDDEAPIVDAIAYNLQKEGFTVDTAADADECLSRVQANTPNLILLDVMLPSASGLDICRRLHQDYADLPVLLLTARAAEVDRLRGFDAGADDYVVKPFSMRELMARVHALLRRTGQSAPPPAPTSPLAAASSAEGGLIQDGIAIDTDRREVLKNGVPIALSRKEFDLLALLAAHRGRVFDRQTLLSRVWGEDCYVDDRTVDVHIRWLREKLEITPARPELLLTVRGVGYKFRG
ncbi:MAG: response regulator transcription factor [Armatimonadota bacterium]|nr:response regulator transcription factor [Armatimonadota bacterium]